MGNRQSSAQLNSHLTHINSQNSNLFISDSKTAVFHTQHILLAAGVGIIATLLVLLLCSCVLNCYLCRKLKRTNGVSSLLERNLRQNGSSAKIYVKPVMQSSTIIEEA
uniref:Nonstructural protein NSP1-1 n=3 Tax=Rotavirus B (isolate RVB/Human/China/ADRV/1982) TaxID=10942 RepID=I7FQK3_ROTGA|nr:putative fusion protein [Human rotavirus B strain CAL-1]AAG09741.1 nonstructural protein [Human rotavirus B strain CAL]AFP25363.1 nonstructural protein NSP1-1 [Human rotavirus B]AFP25368.1 nonstructural protein NSP1-1 [Human rotavirus B]AFP25370.1 nonstructural protein NSP1-1 [Human rotavirus B]